MQRVKINESYTLIWWIICSTVSWTNSLTQISNSKLKTATWYFVWKDAQYICQLHLHNLWLGMLRNTSSQTLGDYRGWNFTEQVRLKCSRMRFTFLKLFHFVFFVSYLLSGFLLSTLSPLLLPALHCHYISNLLPFPLFLHNLRP